MRLCADTCCRKRALFNIEGRPAVFCKQHAGYDMVNIHAQRCSRDSCTIQPTFNTEGIKTAAYCKKHAAAGMLNVIAQRCSRDCCTRRPTFNIEGSKTAKCCRQHATDGMVVVSCNNRWRYDSYTRRPTYNIVGGTTTLYYRKHAYTGMVNVLNKRCFHEPCLKMTLLQCRGPQLWHVLQAAC